MDQILSQIKETREEVATFFEYNSAYNECLYCKQRITYKEVAAHLRFRCPERIVYTDCDKTVKAKHHKQCKECNE